MLNLSFNKSDKAVVAAIRSRSDKVATALVQRMTLLMLKLQAKIVGEKLQGQVLEHRTGKLSGSIHVEPIQANGTSITGLVTGASGPAFYGRFHEEGGEDSYTIAATSKRSLSFMMDGKQVFAKAVTHPQIKQRSFMSSSLHEMESEIRQGIEQAIGTALQE